VTDFTELVSNKIRARFGNGVVLRDLTALAGDASSRRYYRAALSGDAPESLIVMELAGSSLPLSSEELAVFARPPTELPFLNMHRFLSGIGVRVPALYGEWPNEGVLFLEDLGDRSLWDAAQNLAREEAGKLYQKAIDELVKIHVRGTKARDDACIAFQQRFDFRLYMWEFEHFLEYGFLERSEELAADDRALLLRAFERMARDLDSQTPCLNHRDFHSWNLMVRDGEIAVIDFQDALLAPMQYDLASLLNDRETDRVIDRRLEERLVDYYLQRRRELGEAPVERAAFFECYLLSALQRDFKVVGRFQYLARVKGKPQYRKYLPPTLSRLRRNLERAPGLDVLISVLGRYFEEVR
jgi:aminoglycoside/choline kinase family phosphotransferase